MSRFLCFFFLLVINLLHAQVLIDDANPSNNTPNTNALLEVRSNDKAMLLPRLSTSAIDLLTPTEGMIVYDTDIKCFKGYINSSWQFMGGRCLPPGKYQNFDEQNSWTYTADPAPYNVNDEDIWDVFNSLPSITTLDCYFWGMRDLNTGLHTLTFDPVNLTGKTGAKFSFDFESSGLNFSSERYGYELFYDGTSQGQEHICEGCDTDKQGTINIAIPDTVNSFYVVIYATGLDGSDIVAVDNFAITYD